MGLPMARRLCEAGHEVHAWSRTRAKAEGLAAVGATVHDDARAAVAQAAPGVAHLDAPVSGGTGGAQAGTLAIMAGSDAARVRLRSAAGPAGPG